MRGRLERVEIDPPSLRGNPLGDPPRRRGFLPVDQVKGRALLVYWSYEATREEYHRTGVVEWVRDTLSAFGRTRWKRFFHVIR